MAFILSGEPKLPPRIGVETNVSGFRLSWTTNAADYRLENTDSMQASSWSVVTNTPSVSGAKFVVDVEVIATQRYFRLHGP